MTKTVSKIPAMIAILFFVVIIVAFSLMLVSFSNADPTTQLEYKESYDDVILLFIVSLLAFIGSMLFLLIDAALSAKKIFQKVDRRFNTVLVSVIGCTVVCFVANHYISTNANSVSFSYIEILPFFLGIIFYLASIVLEAISIVRCIKRKNKLIDAALEFSDAV